MTPAGVTDLLEGRFTRKQVTQWLSSTQRPPMDPSWSKPSEGVYVFQPVNGRPRASADHTNGSGMATAADRVKQPELKQLGHDLKGRPLLQAKNGDIYVATKL